jgi:protein-disulfide isomerase
MKRLLIGTAILFAACSAGSAQQVKRPAPTDVVATVGPVSITLAEVDDKALQQPAGNFGSARLGQALFEARRAALDEMVSSLLIDQEAKSRGIDRAALVEKEIADKVPQVSDIEITAWYQANRGRLQGASMDDARAPIRMYLLQERMDEARKRYVSTLKAKTAVRILLDPPRQTVAATGPSKGPANAPIQVIEFSDFQCPFCQRAHPTVQQVLSTYGDRVKLVYRHFPLQGHPAARPAAEASACAAEQNQFWQYHDRLFDNPAKLGTSDLKQHAVELRLDTTRFNACVDSRKYKDLVDADMKEGEALGVNGTPAFFINGRLISGAQPFDVFKRIIDEELDNRK